MKLGSLRLDQNQVAKLDGDPVLVSRDLQYALRLSHLAASVREIVENWEAHHDALKELSEKLNQNPQSMGFKVSSSDFLSPLPRAFQWIDGSAFIHHIKLVRKARNAPLPDTLFTVPLIYQGGSDSFLAPNEDIPLIDEAHGLDFESEVAVVTGNVPMGVTAEDALKYIRLVMIVNDVSLRGLIPEELAAGFGFFQSKPSSAFGPVAVTLDELQGYWNEGRVHLPLHTELNGRFFGQPNAKEMHFHFGQIIAHAAKTRELTSGTIVGSGTVSNEDPNAGSSCIVEKRMIEKIELGDFKTPYMKAGDTVKVEMRSPAGENIFGTIFQKVRKF
jgi:fumarylacetoacetate (FAA) hydrolase